MTAIKFHLDEQVANAIAEGLRRRGIDVTPTPEMGMKGVPDEAQLAFARSQDRVIFTQDDDFLKLHSQQVDHCGLILIWEVLTPEDMENHLEFI